MKAKGRAAFDDDEAQVRGADESEEEDVAAMVALAVKRDSAVEADLRASGAHLKHQGRSNEGVVSFEDDNADEGAGRPSKRTKYQHDHQGQARNGKAQAKSSEAAAPAARHVPGQLAHADVVPGAQASQVFGAEAGTWEGAGLAKPLSEQLVGCNFEKPTLVQREAIPLLLAGHDALVKAPTGSGKTLAYLAPIIHDLQAMQPRISRGEGTYALVIAPTRELCLQIQDVAVLLLRRFYWLVTGVLIGGENRAHEKARLRKGVTVLTATPGRLLDHLTNTAAFKTSKLRWLVLDEADRLLDLGFEAKLRTIVEALDKRAQEAGGSLERRRTAMLSATLHNQLGDLASSILREPRAVGFTLTQGEGGIQVQESAQAGPGGTGDPNKGEKNRTQAAAAAAAPAFTIPEQLRQSFLEVPCKQRLMALAGLVRQKLHTKRRATVKGILTKEGGHKKAAAGSQAEVPRVSKIVVFMASCDSVELHHKLLGAFWTAACGAPLLSAPLLKLHGDMVQTQRTATFVQFSQAQSAVLLCTDVAARGLDFPDVTTIIQYDVPGAPAEYVHRVGRTARMGHEGEAVLFLMPSERPYTQLLASRGISLQEDGLDAVLRWLPLTQEAGVEGGQGRKRGKQSSGELTSFLLQRTIMQAVAGDEDMQQLCSDAFRSFVRSYATHPSDVKHIFHVKLLHLGHVAFSMGLKVTPTIIGHSGSSVERKRKKKQAAAAAQQQAKKKLFKAAALTKEG